MATVLPKHEGTSFRSAHVENINIDALLALDPNNMEIDKAYAIGNRNWAAWDMLQDIPRLAVRKLEGPPSDL
ncbi:MAG: hypothetical protein LBF49_02310 [Puniceicoccales bacterium]|nr:hypothetical protein [Puniceicoccales bacterium]